GEPKLDLVGSDSPIFLAALLTLPKVAFAETPHLVLVGHHEVAEKLETALRFFSPEASCFVLPPFDVGVYSGLYPNRRTVADRLKWLWAAQKARPGQIFIASVEAILQRTLPYQVLANGVLRLERNGALPSDFASRLADLGYTQTP